MNLFYIHMQTHTQCMVHVQQCPSPPVTGRCHCSPSLLLCLNPSLTISLRQQVEDGAEEEQEKRGRKAGEQRRPGDRWMLRGPIEYVPPATVEVLLRQRAIPLDENEGIYVRDIKTGKVHYSQNSSAEKVKRNTNVKYVNTNVTSVYCCIQLYLGVRNVVIQGCLCMFLTSLRKY